MNLYTPAARQRLSGHHRKQFIMTRKAGEIEKCCECGTLPRLGSLQRCRQCIQAEADANRRSREVARQRAEAKALARTEGDELGKQRPSRLKRPLKRPLRATDARSLDATSQPVRPHTKKITFADLGVTEADAVHAVQALLAGDPNLALRISRRHRRLKALFEAPRCSVIAAGSGERCRVAAMRGSTVCWGHRARWRDAVVCNIR
jgi:hypothetical protein